MTANDRFRTLVKTHPTLKADGFWWCSGKRWETRRYCVVLTVKHGYKHEGLELKADTPQALSVLLKAEGYPVRPVAIARFCHAAGCSPKRPKRKK